MPGGAAPGPAVETHAVCDYDWIAEPRERMRLSPNPENWSVDSAAAASGLDPYSDQLARHAMHAHARLGNADAIRRQLDQLRHALDELNEQPTDETTTLAATLIRQLARSQQRHSRREKPNDVEGVNES